MDRVPGDAQLMGHVHFVVTVHDVPGDLFFSRRQSQYKPNRGPLRDGEEG
jgi:hypothetical protein